MQQRLFEITPDPDEYPAWLVDITGNLITFGHTELADEIIEDYERLDFSLLRGARVIIDYLKENNDNQNQDHNTGSE